MDDAPAHRSRGPARRTMLLAGVAVIGGGAAGVGIGFATSGGVSSPAPQAVDRQTVHELVAAVAAERNLVAAAASARRSARGAQRRLLDEIRQDHLAHLRALEAVLNNAQDPSSPSATRSATPARAGLPGATPVSGARLRAAESDAAAAATDRAMRMSGTPAALLATIAASEAAHAEALR